MPHIELEENNTPQNEWDNTQSIHSGDFFTGNLRCAMDRAIIAKIVYRSIWGVHHCPHNYSVFVHLLLSYSERCTMTADEGPHWTYFPGCGEVFRDPCLWADEARDAYAAWYKTGGRIKDCEDHAVLDVYHYKKDSEGGREISSTYPYFHPRPVCEEVLSETAGLITKKYRKAVSRSVHTSPMLAFAKLYQGSLREVSGSLWLGETLFYKQDDWKIMTIR